MKRIPKDSEKEKDFDIQDSNRYGAYYVCTFTHKQSLIDSICINACLLKHCPFNNDIHFPYTLDMGQTIKTCLTTGNGTVE